MIRCHELQTWPHRLHAAARARRVSEGHAAGHADLHAALDVLRLARLTYPDRDVADALRHLAANQIGDPRRCAERTAASTPIRALSGPWTER